jgi:hypothetical protein
VVYGVMMLAIILTFFGSKEHKNSIPGLSTREEFQAEPFPQ